MKPVFTKEQIEEYNSIRARLRIVNPTLEKEKLEKLLFRFSPKQWDAFPDFLNPELDEICYDGGARSGKTAIIIRAIVDRALAFPNSRHLIARLRFNHMVTSVWIQTLIKQLKERGLLETVSINEQYKIITFPNGSSIWGAGLDDKDRITKIMGTEYNTVFINEATEVSYSVYQSLKSRLSLNVEGCNNLMIVDCNPRNTFHWIYKYFVIGKAPDTNDALPINTTLATKRRTWTPADNPFLAPQYRRTLASFTGVEYERLVKGMWVNPEGLVYPDFDKIIVDPFPIPDHWETFGAVDFGFTNAFAFGWFAYDKSNETFYLIDEIHEEGKTTADHCKEILKRKKPNWIAADHDAEDREVMRRAGLPTRAANKEVSIGIQTVTQFITAQQGYKLRVFRTCVNAIEEMSLYSWKENKEGRNSDEAPVKNKDHAPDMIRYFCMEVNRAKATIMTSPIRPTNNPSDNYRTSNLTGEQLVNRIRQDMYNNYDKTERQRLGLPPIDYGR